MDQLLLGQKLSLIFGIISNVSWMFVFVPQFYKNYINKNAEGMSLLLLFCLMLGDSFSIISAVLKNLSPVIIYSGVYHIILGTVIVLQFLYYRRKIILELNYLEREPLLDISSTYSLYSEAFSDYEYFYLNFTEFIFFISTICILSITIIIVNIQEMPMIADLIAWTATFIFIMSRIPQIILNTKRKSTEGLSLLSFIIINFANLFFFLSILIVLVDLKQSEYITYIISNIQWIIGPICSTFFDIIIFYQFIKYKTINVVLNETYP